MAAASASLRSTNTPLNTSSVTSSSSAVFTSHATRPLVAITPDSPSTKLSFLSTRCMRFIWSRITGALALRAAFLSVFALSSRSCRLANASILAGRSSRLCSGSLLKRLSRLCFRAITSSRPCPVTFMSTRGSSTGIVPAMRRRTSPRVLDTLFRCSRLVRSLGKKIRTTDKSTMDDNAHRSTRISPLEGWSEGHGLGAPLEDDAAADDPFLLPAAAAADDDDPFSLSGAASSSSASSFRHVRMTSTTLWSAWSAPPPPPPALAP
mmetsp:Transcript_22841/g.45327  ORF Transcript_22841/g.45327 Transcript_22841/m.45327 type:complete len:265 (+) Transcript_22841:590-1384(+)